MIATQSEAESARDSTDSWDTIPVYACVVKLGVFDEQKLQQLRDVFDDVSKPVIIREYVRLA